ncbi:MAG: alpha/beta hydrolase fold domain-containing protein [Mycolicibacterium sp.]|uniref:alpha/beta hydrolase fold domain-containing protein n=1 Tax=Mycolicibacterium sp. TaxID=2320850 RepID=UPI003D10B95B
MTETPSGTPTTVSLPDGPALQQLMGHLNGSPGPRVVPGRSIPAPTSVSAAMQQAIAMPYRNNEWLLNPPDAAGWNAAIANLAQQSSPQIEKIVEKLDVRVESTTIAGVGVFIVTPPQIPAANANRLLVNTHGGGYLFNPGRASLLEPAVIAAACGITVIEVDYRMPPDHPFPAASDDAMAVWKAALQMAPPANIGLCGGSAGGGLALSTVLRAKNEGVALPAAVAVQTPWCDLAAVGDSLKVHEWVDNILVTYDAIAGRGASLYAGDEDISNPLLSPLRGEVSGFPPTMLISGTRDLLLSQVVLMHRKLRKAGVDADLHLVEGASHFTYFIDPFAPESQDIFAEMALFWDQHLGS